jgi:hypothetical protein
MPLTQKEIDDRYANKNKNLGKKRTTIWIYCYAIETIKSINKKIDDIKSLSPKKADKFISDLYEFVKNYEI